MLLNFVLEKTSKKAVGLSLGQFIHILWDITSKFRTVAIFFLLKQCHAALVDVFATYIRIKLKSP
jgi:hypothetical protein